MSYVLYVWEAPVPASVLDAERLRGQLAAERRDSNPKFIELAHRLTARHPCITTLDDDDLAAVWSDGPLDGKSDTAVLGIGIQTHALNTVVPFVAATANDLGLVVYDMQAGEAHLPGGATLTLPGRRPVVFDRPAPAHRIESRADLALRLQTALSPWLERDGFKALKGKAAFRRRLTECTQEIRFEIDDFYPRYDMTLLCVVMPKFRGGAVPLVHEYTTGDCCLDLNLCAARAGVSAPGKPVRGFLELEVDSTEALATLATGTGEYLSAAVLPVLRACETVRELDSQLNPPEGEPGSLFIPHVIDLLVAYAAGNPRLDVLLAARREATTSPYQRGKLDEFLAKLQSVRVAELAAR